MLPCCQYPSPPSAAKMQKVTFHVEVAIKILLFCLLQLFLPCLFLGHMCHPHLFLLHFCIPRLCLLHICLLHIFLLYLCNPHLFVLQLFLFQLCLLHFFPLHNLLLLISIHLSFLPFDPLPFLFLLFHLLFVQTFLLYLLSSLPFYCFFAVFFTIASFTFSFLASFLFLLLLPQTCVLSMFLSIISVGMVQTMYLCTEMTLRDTDIAPVHRAVAQSWWYGFLIFKSARPLDVLLCEFHKIQHPRVFYCLILVDSHS